MENGNEHGYLFHFMNIVPYLALSFPLSEKFMVDTEPHNHFESLFSSYITRTFSMKKSYFLLTRAPKRMQYYI